MTRDTHVLFPRGREKELTAVSHGKQIYTLKFVPWMESADRTALTFIPHFPSLLRKGLLVKEENYTEKRISHFLLKIWK